MGRLLRLRVKHCRTFPEYRGIQRKKDKTLEQLMQVSYLLL